MNERRCACCGARLEFRQETRTDPGGQSAHLVRTAYEPYADQPHAGFCPDNPFTLERTDALAQARLVQADLWA